MNRCDLPSCDVLIVGGGPAGLAAAIAIQLRGLTATIVDAVIPPVEKACGEGLMPDARVELARLGVEISRGREFSGIQFVGKESTATAELKPGSGVGVRRIELHRRLRDRAEELGVRCEWGTRAELSPGGNVLVAGKPLGYRYLVGADGEASRVRRFAGLEEGSIRSRRLGFRRHYQVAPWSDHVEVHWADAGQIYVTPVASEEVCVAAITRHKGVHFDDILMQLPSLRERLQGQNTTGRDRGAVTTTRKLNRVTRRNIALIGDASGSADAITGEGLASAFRQAQLLADAISRNSLPAYEEGHRRILRLPRAMASVLLAMDRHPAWRDRVLRSLAGNPDLFSRMLSVHTSGESLFHFGATQGFKLGLNLLFPQISLASAIYSASQVKASNSELSLTEVASS